MRRLVLLVYALLFVNEVQQASIIPLLPELKAGFDLSTVEAGAILSTTTFATVVVGVPVGLLADRVGARILTVAAGCLLVVSALVQAFAGDFWTFLAGRGLLGLAYGTVWTAGLALIRDSTSARRSSALGGTVTVGGLAYLTGPPATGFAYEHFGIEAPFVAMSVAAVLVTVLLARAPAARAIDRSRQRLLPALRALRSAHTVRSALLLIALVGSIMGVVQLLVPLRLGENGLSPGEIGAVFSASSAVWIVVSGLVARRGDRAVRVQVAGVGLLLLGGVFLLPLATLSTTAVVAFVLLRSGFGAPLSTIVYPLSETGARAVDVGGGIVLGVMNAAWGGAAVVAPLVAGALAQTVGERWTFGVVVGLCLAAGSWMLLSDRRATRAAAAVGCS